MQQTCCMSSLRLRLDMQSACAIVSLSKSFRLPYDVPPHIVGGLHLCMLALQLPCWDNGSNHDTLLDIHAESNLTFLGHAC